ncbi:MAG: enoyl-CoA hydratase-related protein [Nocardioides sp.]|jgi:2-(1,2-epoxy-1,2-dihydrophenyl)acetyl-CoA isomerase
MTDPVLSTVADGIAHLELNRPEAANAFDMALATALFEAVEWAAGEDQVRAVLLTGSGPRFCAGGDVASFLAGDDVETELRHLALAVDRAVRALEGLAKPVVAAVHGAVAGAGLPLMLSADVVVADPGTKFVFAYPGIGLSPDAGASYLLPRAMGQQRALAFALTGEVLTAQGAQASGLVTQVAEGAADVARGIAQQWAGGPATALGHARRLLRAGWQMEREEMGIEEARTISNLVNGAEAKALIAKFLSR